MTAPAVLTPESVRGYSLDQILSLGKATIYRLSWQSGALSDEDAEKAFLQSPLDVQANVLYTHLNMAGSGSPAPAPAAPGVAYQAPPAAPVMQQGAPPTAGMPPMPTMAGPNTGGMAPVAASPAPMTAPAQVPTMPTMGPAMPAVAPMMGSPAVPTMPAVNPPVAAPVAQQAPSASAAVPTSAVPGEVIEALKASNEKTMQWMVELHEQVSLQARLIHVLLKLNLSMSQQLLQLDARGLRGLVSCIDEQELVDFVNAVIPEGGPEGN